MKRKAELEEKLTEEEQSRTDFLYDHEVDVRKKALDDELEDFEDQINTKIAEIENFLDKQGLIRQQAIDLINGKSEQFYNDLLDYTLTYTSTSKYELNQLWDSAYSAILKYADGELNVDLALMNLIASMKVADEQLKNIENSINNIKHATDAAKEAMYEFNKVTGDTVAKVHDLYSSPIGPGLPNSPLYNESQLYMRKQAVINGGGMTVADIMKYIRGYHTGGIVEGVSTEHGEVLAKLLSGEVVATEGQARQFMEKTLPKLAGTTVNNNASLAPVINMGDINISGNADQSIVDKLRSVQKDIVNDVFRVINNQKNIYNGGMIR